MGSVFERLCCKRAAIVPSAWLGWGFWLSQSQSSPERKWGEGGCRQEQVAMGVGIDLGEQGGGGTGSRRAGMGGAKGLGAGKRYKG